MDRKTLTTIAVIAVMAVVPLAGCIGGSSGGGGPAGEAGEETGLTGNQTEANASAGNVAHVHPRWDDPTTDGYDELDEVTLVESEFQVKAQDNSEVPPFNGCEESGGDAGGGTTLCMGSVTFEPGEWPDGTPKIVPPGTGNITVQVSWGGDASIQGLRVSFRHRQTPPGDWAEATVSGSPITESGGQASIPVENEKWTDDGHAKETAWAFALDAYDNPANTEGPVHYAEGTVQVKVVAERIEGELPKEPPHPDYWNGTDTYQIGALDDTVGQHAQAGPVCVTEEEVTPTLNCKGLRWAIDPGWNGYRYPTPPEELNKVDAPYVQEAVPPQSKLLTMVLKVEGSQSQAGAQICGYYSTNLANAWAGATPLGDSACQTLQDGTFTFTKELEPQEWDSLYAGSSNASVDSLYTFFVQVAPPTATQNPRQTYQVGDFAIESLSAGIYVTKASSFAAPSWASPAPE